MSLRRGFTIGDWTAYPLEGRLVGPDGEQHVQPKSMDVLLYLAESGGAVVGRDAVLHHVWGERAQSDEPLTRCIGELRRALGDTSAQPDYILTIPKRGYQLLKPVAAALTDAAETGDADASELTEPQRKLRLDTVKKIAIAAVVLLSAALIEVLFERALEETDLELGSNESATTEANTRVAPDEKSIAVLPFVNVSADKENEYFADGLSEEILNRLTHLPELHVTSRTSSFSFKGRNEDLRTIGDRLGVAHILEGSVRRQADQVRVTAQLIRAQDGFHLWSEAFDFQLNDVFAVQDAIAESVAGALDILLDEETRGMMQDAGIRNVEAFVAYQRGVDLFNRAHDVDGSERIEMLAEANRSFDEAIENAADFAAAYFLKVDYFAHLTFMHGTSLEQQRVAILSLRDALQQASRNARDPKRRAMIDFEFALFGDDWTQIRSNLEDTARLPGCRSGNWIGELGAFLPTLTEKITTEWMSCEPLSTTPYRERSEAIMYSGRGEEALAVLDLGINKLGPRSSFSIFRTRLLLALGRFDAARNQAESIESRSSRIDALETYILAAEGRLELAKQSADLWFADYPGELRHESSQSIALEIAAATGQRQLANEIAARLDASPAGAMSLTTTVKDCFCGAPFDIDVTPNFRARIQEAGLSWPPPSPIKYPAKNW
jgi:TolB-like protein/DNA-binding winged helix-turn-helix (wHTH) protein